MSRLIEKLTRIRQTEPQPMGFMLAKPAPEKPRLQMIAYLNKEHLDKLSTLADTVDAVIVEVANSGDLDALEKVCQDKGKTIGGVWLKVSGGSTLKKAFSAACDFMVIPPSTALNLFPKEKPGCILELDAALGDGLLRTINDLPVDAVLIFGRDVVSPLTLDRLMLVQRVSYMVNKPILMSVSTGYSEAEMQAVWEAGISAVVVEPSDEKSLEKLAELRKVIDKLPPPSSRRKDRIRAVLPQIQPEQEKPEEDEEEEEEDE
jgi:hypothetical protein